MKLSLNWLQDYIDTSDLSAQELADKLNLSGTEVEGIISQGEGLKNVISAQIKSIKQHPQADRLVLCEVDTGEETVQIVCGAKNMKEGDNVALTLPGACLPNGMEIKKSKIRGEVSLGMLASEVELGLSEESDGILILDKDVKPGQKIADLLELNDTILELEITPNRPDQMSMIGMAREISAILGRDFNIPTVKINESNNLANDAAEVNIEDPEFCTRYTAKIIDEVLVGESPKWLKKRLIAAGARPINNLVDITNYVLFETGQPLHAFDYDLLEGSQINVRNAKKGEKIVSLDNTERELNTDNLVIADSKKAVAIAGVMGGSNSEVSSNTKKVLLESAYFKPASVGKTSRKLGLISESSMRFERGVDPSAVEFAANRAAQLIQELAGGKVYKNCIDVNPVPFSKVKLNLRPVRVSSILGVEIPIEEIFKKLTSLGLYVVEDQNNLSVEVPTFRPDITREIDLIEEIGRLYGLNNIPSVLPGFAQVGRQTKMDSLQEKIRQYLTGFGLEEALTYSFIDPSWLKNYPLIEKKPVEILNPLSQDQSVLRPSLMPGLLNSLKYNVSRGQINTQLFEIGTVFQATESLPVEKRRLGIILNGSFNEKSWSNDENNLDFYDAKGLVEAIKALLNISEKNNFKQFEHSLFNPQKSFELSIGKDKIGIIGEFHPAYCEKNDLISSAYVEFELDTLLKLSVDLVPYQIISAYPSITLDVAMLVDKNVRHEQIVNSIKTKAIDLLSEVKLFDIYDGKGIEPDKKSMAYSLVYQSADRTLELAEIQKIHDSIIENLKKDLKIQIR